MSDWRPSAPPPGGPDRPPHPSQDGPASRQQQQAPHRARPSAGSHDAHGMHSVLERARDQSRFEPPVIEPEVERKPFPWRAVVLLFVLVLVAAVAAGAVYALFLRETEVDPATIVQVSEGPTAAPIRSPQDAVRQYFEALADGDIRTALSLGEVGGIGSRALLSTNAHAAMREAAPIEGIQILTEDPGATEVDVTYTLAGNQVTTTVPVVRSDSGSYELARTTVTVLIELDQADAVPLLVNGVEVQKFAPLEVVPGFYRVSSGLRFIEYPQDNSFTIGSLGFATETRLTATPRLTDAGADALRAAVDRSLRNCFSQRALSPEGCPQSIRAPQSVNPSTIQWELIGNPMANSEPSLSAEDMSVGSMTLDLRYSVSFAYQDGSDSGRNDGARAARATANMLGDDPSQVSVTWQP